MYLVLNKLDLVSKGTLLEKIADYKDLLAFREIVPVSAKLGRNLEPLWTVLERDAPAGEWVHPEETFTDQTERGMAAEFIREKVLRKTREEVPHGVAVEIRAWIEAGADGYPEDGPEGGACIEAEIVVERAGHRKILLGSGGEMIQDIRQSAQRELKKLLQRPVRLALHIGWRRTGGTGRSSWTSSALCSLTVHTPCLCPHGAREANDVTSLHRGHADPGAIGASAVVVAELGAAARDRHRRAFHRRAAGGHHQPRLPSRPCSSRPGHLDAVVSATGKVKFAPLRP